jgi:hypothetical protein
MHHCSGTTAAMKEQLYVTEQLESSRTAIGISSKPTHAVTKKLAPLAVVRLMSYDRR